MRGLAKAKKTDSNEWVIGCLLQSEDYCFISSVEELFNEDGGIHEDGRPINNIGIKIDLTPVEAETVCLHTGHEDNIFEGDEVKWTDPVTHYDHIGFVEWNKDCFRYEVNTDKKYNKSFMMIMCWELTGSNIHDHKEEGGSDA